jgi:RNA methyltransferase, TrmH family
MKNSPVITSRQNVRVKDAAKLRQRRQRTRQGRFLIDGIREINRALDAGIEVVEAYVCASLCESAASQATAERLAQGGVPLWQVAPAVFEKLCFGQREDGVVVVAVSRILALGQLQLPPKPLVAILESVEKPGNVGAMLRSADGAGVHGIILADPCTDLLNPNTIRASLGTLFGLNICTATTEEAIHWLRIRRIPAIMARPDATRLYTQGDYRGPAALVLGNEAEGLSSRWNSVEGEAIRLPMHGIADSLNVSATAAVLFYEAQRQRQSPLT